MKKIYLLAGVLWALLYTASLDANQPKEWDVSISPVPANASFYSSAAVEFEITVKNLRTDEVNFLVSATPLDGGSGISIQQASYQALPGEEVKIPATVQIGGNGYYALGVKLTFTYQGGEEEGLVRYICFKADDKGGKFYATEIDFDKEFHLNSDDISAIQKGTISSERIEHLKKVAPKEVLDDISSKKIKNSGTFKVYHFH